METEKTRWRDRVKDSLKEREIQKTVVSHWRNHKETYVKVGIALGVAAFTCAITRERHAPLLSGGDGPSQVTVRSLSVFQNHSPQIVTTIHSGGRGHPGFRVQSVEHGLVFDTQGAAARAFEIPESILSSHLNGKFEDACGLHFKRVEA